MKPSWRMNSASAASGQCGSNASPWFMMARIEAGFRADLVVEDLVIVELKSVETLAPVHKKQLLTHLRLAGKRLGLLINFNVVLIKDGITRIANGLLE
jgi:GxxExxY protein